uniref:hypothetical protein n=1 Tax=Jatropha curcas TaxID=180498 RepID=UPI00279B6766|nr:hypothetical protein QLP06_mgp019 [Jatropha curcas]WFG81220.1 hypothetical protein [Jatropha curcas]
MFVCRRHGRCLILLLYVDDNILTGNDSSLLFSFIKELGNRLFHPLHYFLGMEVSRSTSGLLLPDSMISLITLALRAAFARQSSSIGLFLQSYLGLLFHYQNHY